MELEEQGILWNIKFHMSQGVTFSLSTEMEAHN